MAVAVAVVVAVGVVSSVSSRSYMLMSSFVSSTKLKEVVDVFIHGWPEEKSYSHLETPLTLTLSGCLALVFSLR